MGENSLNMYINASHLKILSLFILLVSNFLLADTASDDLVKRLNNLQTFQSDYQQTVFDNTGKVIEESTGKFYLGNDKAFKNSIEQPEKSAMISDGKKLWLIDYELEQVSVSYLKHYLQASPLSLLLGDAAQSLTNFTIKKTENTALTQVLYQLSANDALASIVALRLSFKASKINYIELDERSGNKVRINFSNTLEFKHADEVFKVSIPEGFDLVDET